jgi:hypothetical protein
MGGLIKIMLISSLLIDRTRSLLGFFFLFKFQVKVMVILCDLIVLVLSGEPLCDIIPLHLDVFRGDTDLLREFLRSYQLPLLKGESNADIYKTVQNSKFSRASYRAM